MPESIDWPPPHPVQPRRRRLFLLILVVLAVIFFGGRTALSYYVDALWFGSLGYGSVFWKTLGLQWGIFAAFTAATFLILFGSFLALKRAHLPDLPSGHTIFIGGQPLKLPVEPVLRLIALGISLVIAAATGASMMVEWPTLALFWYAPRATGGVSVIDPIFGKPLNFFLFALPAWQLIAGWLLTLAVIICFLAVIFVLITGGSRVIAGRLSRYVALPWRGLSITFAFLLLIVAMRVYIGRFELLLEDHTIFGGVTYTDAHITLTGMLIVCAALVLGAVVAAVNAVRTPRGRWLVAAILPAAVCYISLQVVAWYVSSFIVKPNELVREQPYIVYNTELTRQAYGLNRVAQREFPAETTVDAAEPANNQATLQNIRLWDWRALQDTLRQIQEIRTYYDFPDIDIDRYEIDGTNREVMLAARELNVDKLPESSRNWINDKLIYTHGYGITMNPVNGFTPEGLPTLMLSNMPVQSTVRGLSVTRPEIYFGEMTNTDVYVKTRQKEFNYPQGASNNLTSYEGNGGIVLGGFLRRIAIALDRGDLAKLPFSDDVTQDSRLLMRRNLRDRVSALAPFLTFDPDPYIVLGDDGRLSWIMDAFTLSDSYPYSTHYQLDSNSINYMRNSVKVVIDAYDGTTTFYVFDTEDPIIAAYRRIFPSLFKDASTMPAGLRKHVRYPEMLLKLQAEVYGLYHMTDPGSVLQPRGSVDGGHRSRHGRGRSASHAGDAAELRADETAGRSGRGVRGDSAFHAGQPEQPDWLDCRAQRRRTLRHVGGLQLSQDEAGRRTAANRGAHRSERAAFRTTDAVESAGLARAARGSAGDSDRARAVVCGADLPAGRAQSDAGTASGRTRAARQAGVRTKLRVGDGGAFWRSVVVPERRFDEHRGRAGARHARGQRCAPDAVSACGGPQHAHRGSRQRPCRLPAPDGGRQARRGWAEAGRVEARARQVERAPTVVARRLRAGPQ